MLRLRLVFFPPFIDEGRDLDDDGLDFLDGDGLAAMKYFGIYFYYTLKGNYVPRRRRRQVVEHLLRSAVFTPWTPPLRQTYGKFRLRWNGGGAIGATCVLRPFPYF